MYVFVVAAQIEGEESTVSKTMSQCMLKLLNDRSQMNSSIKTATAMERGGEGRRRERKGRGGEGTRGEGTRGEGRGRQGRGGY